MEKDLLQSLVASSNSIIEILDKLKEPQTKANIEELKSKFDSNDIDYSHLPIKTIFEKIPLEEILVESSNYQSAKLKKRLIDEGVKEDVCEICH